MVTEPKTPLGRQMREARKAAGLTQVETAERMGTYQGYLGGLERGETSPNVLMLIRFCQAVGCGFTWDGEFRLTPEK